MRGGHESAEREEVRDQKEHTPVEEEDTPQHAPSPSDNVCQKFKLCGFGSQNL